MLRDILAASLVRQFGDGAMRLGTPEDVIAPAAYGELIARFPAAHPAVGDATVWCASPEERESNEWWCSASVSVGTILVQDAFMNFDAHLQAPERHTRVSADVVRFLRELFADRLLLWTSEDGSNAAWRERGEAGHVDPLVTDDRIYLRYFWSGPLPPWRATAAILARGRIADEREQRLVLQRLNDAGPAGFADAERALAQRLLAGFEGGS